MKLRATTRSDRLTLVPAEVPDIHGGPAACLARAALPPNVSVADLEVGVESEEAEDGEEQPEAGVVEVRFMVNDAPAARRVIKRWAANAGHRRIWFRDEVEDLEPPERPDGEFATRCTCCGLEISDSGPSLMGFVREAGCFPMTCFVCGSFVPQWESVLKPAETEARTARRRRARGDEHQLRVVDA